MGRRAGRIWSLQVSVAMVRSSCNSFILIVSCLNKFGLGPRIHNSHHLLSNIVFLLPRILLLPPFKHSYLVTILSVHIWSTGISMYVSRILPLPLLKHCFVVFHIRDGGFGGGRYGDGHRRGVGRGIDRRRGRGGGWRGKASTTPCRHFIIGNCRNGDDCAFMHRLD